MEKVEWDWNAMVTLSAGCPTERKRARRHGLLIRKYHLDMETPSLGAINKSDVGRVLIVDEYIDGDVIDSIVDRKNHYDSWFKYGGFKLTEGGSHTGEAK